MKAMVLRIAVLTSVTLATVNIGTIAARKKTNLTGQIIAFRSADRILQMSSSVKNREVFVFLLRNSSVTSSKHLFLKVVYDHFGQSDLTYDALRKTPVLRLKAYRESSCDELFGTLVSDAPTIRSEQPNGQSVEGITYLGEFQGINIPSDQLLKCYTIGKGDYRIVTSAGEGHAYDASR